MIEALTVVLFLFSPRALSAQETILPVNCYADDGLVDLQTCPTMPWDIPEDQLRHGYYGVLGTLVPGLPQYDLNTLTSSSYLIGSATYMSQGLMPIYFQEKVTLWSLDASLYLDGIALDSCGYMQQVAWIRIHNSASSWMGPFLVVDCAAFIHKYERACQFGTVAELGYETFAHFQKRGRLDNLEVYIMPLNDVSQPPDALSTPPLAYAADWLQQARMSC